MYFFLHYMLRRLQTKAVCDVAENRGYRVVCEWGSRRVGRWRGVSPLPCIHAGSNDMACRWLLLLCGSEGQFSGNSAQKDCWEHCKTPWWQCWFNGSQPLRWWWKFSGRNNTIYETLLASQTYQLSQKSFHCFRPSHQEQSTSHCKKHYRPYIEHYSKDSTF